MVKVFVIMFVVGGAKHHNDVMAVTVVVTGCQETKVVKVIIMLLKHKMVKVVVRGA